VKQSACGGMKILLRKNDNPLCGMIIRQGGIKVDFHQGENLNYSKKVSSEKMRLFIVIITKFGYIVLYISLKYVRGY
jgi:hypothetical protein